MSVKKMLNNLARELRVYSKKGLITKDFFEHRNNQGSKHHSRIFGILAKVGIRMGYVVDIERGVKPEGFKQFTPDIIFSENKKLIYAIEYESSNSSDSRLWRKDLRHYLQCLKGVNNQTPKNFVVITSLENRYVKNCWSWDYNRKSKKYKDLRKNPYKFYFRKFLHKVRNKSDNKIPILIANLNSEGLELAYPFKRKWRINF